MGAAMLPFSLVADGLRDGELMLWGYGEGPAHERRAARVSSF